MDIKDKEKEKEYNKAYYNKNKVKTIAKQCLSTECPECKCMIQNWNITRHRKTKKHVSNIRET
jgi:hypothetical protein